MAELTLRFVILSDERPLEERIVVGVEPVDDEILAWLVTWPPAGLLAQAPLWAIRPVVESATIAARKLFITLFMIHARFLFSVLRLHTLRPSALLSVKTWPVLQRALPYMHLGTSVVAQVSCRSIRPRDCCRAQPSPRGQDRRTHAGVFY